MKICSHMANLFPNRCITTLLLQSRIKIPNLYLGKLRYRNGDLDRTVNLPNIIFPYL